MEDNLDERQATRKPPPPKQTGRVGQLLFVVQQAAQALAAERLEPLGLSPRAWGVLSTLAESGPLTQIDLATTMSIDRTAMVYLIDELEAAALVERVRHPQDRRAFLIHLTPGGQDLQARAAAALGGAAQALLAPLDTAESRLLVDLLAKVAAHWQQVSAGRPDPGPGPAWRSAARTARGEPPARARPRRAPAPGRGHLHFLTVIFLSSYSRCMFEVLVEPHRRRILDLLRDGERTVGGLVADLGLSQPGVSKHLRVLRRAGLVEVHADAQRRLYRLRTEPLREIDEWLAPYRAAWSDRLDALESHLDEMAD
jgi:DNA-binding MarR family transcriptional regulator